MRKVTATGLFVLALLLVACEGYSQSGVSSQTRSGLNGGEQRVRVGKASGTSEQDIEVEDGSSTDLVLETDVTLSVGKGMFRIELLGQDDQVTVELEARDGQTVSGRGQMVVDAFGDASYRVTAEDAENVEYTINWTYR
ncbi:hypothetical protein ACFLWA_04155 [Chloroflexota bacterium]